ncbi:hypothetical protein Tco_1004932 [Tanacetum coccineum]|uniref:Uncharacterized protein n=1 Tax=Tanacetum coccineum TaxID=301880 RepID=A0ABQ5FED9_9ASTR
MVAFLKKPTEMLFWQTATVRTLANGIQELAASIDNKEYTITEASIKSQLQLANTTGITNLPDAEIYEGLATLGGFAGEHVPLLPAMLAGAAPDQGEGSAIPAGSQPTPDPGPTVTPVADEATTTGVGVETEGATTTTTGLDAGLDSGTGYSLKDENEAKPDKTEHGFEKSAKNQGQRSHEATFPEGNTSGSTEDSLNLKELMDIVPKLVLKIDNLEKELQQTKSTYRKAVLTLVERVKLLEAALKRKSRKVILFESEDEETEDQGRKI